MKLTVSPWPLRPSMLVRFHFSKRGPTEYSGKEPNRFAAARFGWRTPIPLHLAAKSEATSATAGPTVVHVALDGRVAGLIAIADAPRETPVAAGRPGSVESVS